MSAAERGQWAATTLLRYFSGRSGRWRTPTGEAWQPALAIEVVLAAYARTREVAWLNVAERSFDRYRGRRSRFFDDNGWYLNAWLTGYDATGDPKYLTEARALFAAMTLGWDGRCGGGLWWSGDRTYKNAITNELFLLAAARLHRRTGEPDYRDWAERTWAWFDGSGLVNDDGLVNDGMDASCGNNGQTTWTYNQGVILGGLVELWRITGDGALLATARRIADATIRLLSTSDILREPSEPDPGNADAHVFKGILTHHLATLHRADPTARPVYADFLTGNAERVWASARDPARGAGLGWAERPSTVNAATHTSASLLFTAVAELDRADPGPVRPPWSAGTRYEAEAAQLGGLGTETVHIGYTGVGYVAGWYRDGQFVNFAVRAAQSRPYSLTLRYAAGAGDAYRCLLVDAEVVADALLCTGTGGWGRYSTVSVDVPLPAGARTVSVRYDTTRGSRGRLNLDSLTLR